MGLLTTPSAEGGLLNSAGDTITILLTKKLMKKKTLYPAQTAKDQINLALLYYYSGVWSVDELAENLALYHNMRSLMLLGDELIIHLHEN